MATQHLLTSAESESLIGTLKTRFEANKNRHINLKWSAIEKRLMLHPEKLWSLHEMERTGGEPDVVVNGNSTGEVVFYDCSEESPKGRRSLCYDREGLESRKEHPPKHTAIDVANDMGVNLFTEEDYRTLQKLGAFDLKTSNWLKTPSDIRKLGGAIFADFRFGHVFVYHNGAQSYYAGRGFRASLSI